MNGLQQHSFSIWLKINGLLETLRGLEVQSSNNKQIPKT